MVEETETKENQETKPETVTKERFDEVNTRLKAAEEQNELLQQNQALLRANAPVSAQGEAFDIYKEVGLEGPEDIPNVEQSRKINTYYQGIAQRRDAQIRFLIDHPDYPEVVGTAEQIRNGQFAEPLKEAIRANPTLMATIQNSADPQAAAYSIAKLHTKKKAEGDTTKTTKPEAQAAIDEAVENAARVKTSANTKGGAGLAEEGRVATMPDAEFIKLANACGADL